MTISAADRDFIDARLREYGSAWDGGLDGLERDFIVEVTPDLRNRVSSKHRGYTLKLALRAPAGFVAELKLSPSSLTGGLVSVPDGPTLTAEELSAVEAALEQERFALISGPDNGELIRLELSEGTEALCRATLDTSVSLDASGAVEPPRARSLVTRRRGGFACLYVVGDRAFDDPFCLWLSTEGDAMAVAGATWGGVPASRGRLLDRDTVAFLDNACRENGDFGVYGNVTCGLVDLTEFMQVQLALREADEHHDGPRWAVSATPRDGHGHFLHFEIDGRTGAIDGVAAGHLIPAPRPGDR